jgi:hypothetical protein
MKTPRIVRSATLRGRRGIVLFVAGALAMGLGTAGVRALADGSSSPTRLDRAGPVTQMPVASAAVEPPAPPATVETPSPTAEPAPDPNALADGLYPTFVRAVDVEGATVTVDVLQVFVGEAEQHQAAIEDGVPWRDVQYNPVYIRNENPLLRTLPVARDVRIRFYGWCDRPNRWAGLTELRKEAASSGEAWYYEMTIVGGNVVGIEQKVAPPGGC